MSGERQRLSEPFRIGDVIVDPKRSLLFRDDSMLDVPDHYVAVLIRLAKDPLTIVRRHELISAIKEVEGAGVTDDVLNKAIQKIRGIVGKKAIRTVRNRGYRLAPESIIESEGIEPASTRSASMPTPRQEPAFSKREPSFEANLAEPQLTRWDPREVGIWAGTSTTGGSLIVWEKLKKEAEENLLPQVPEAPAGSTVVVGHLDGGRRNWIVRIVGADGNEIGHMWFGSDPYKNWAADGLVRVGEVPGDRPIKVWQVLQRYSDGSYKTIKRYT